MRMCVSMQPPKFLLDSMLGRLCRWLRALGVDAEFVEPASHEQQQQQQQQGRQRQQGKDGVRDTLIQLVQEAAVLQVRVVWWSGVRALEQLPACVVACGQ
jgi:hypothetical protein